MTKITNELLEDYAMLYPRIECVKCNIKNGDNKTGLFYPLRAIHEEHNGGIRWNIAYIQLRSIDSIPRRLVKLISKIQGYKYDTNEQTKKVIINNFLKLNAHCIDLLRKEGYATPFRGITVDELVESGKLKLI